MKKIILSVVLLLPVAILLGQDLGVVAGLNMFKGLDKRDEDTSSTSSPLKFHPGIRADLMYLLPDFDFPVSALTSLNVNVFFPYSDSGLVGLENPQTYSRIVVKVPVKYSAWSIALKMGYEIPQEIDKFLMLNFGWAMGYKRVKTIFELPPVYSAAGYQMDPNTSLEIVNNQSTSGGFYLEVFAGANYDLDFLRIMLQGGLSFNVAEGNVPSNDFDSMGLLINATVFIPFKRW